MDGVGVSTDPSLLKSGTFVVIRIRRMVHTNPMGAKKWFTQTQIPLWGKGYRLSKCCALTISRQT